MQPVAALLLFTIRQTVLSRKIWLTALLLAAPCCLVLTIRCFAPPRTNARELWEMYHVLAQFFLTMGLLPLVCMVHGTALIGAEVEARTFVYLITRRMRRATVLLVKFAATALVLAVLCDVAMVGIHLSALGGRDMATIIAQSNMHDWNPTSDLFCYLRVIPLAVLGFLAVFSLFGLVTARPLTLSVFYLVAFELVLSNIPIRARAFTLLHQVRAIMAGPMPRVPDLYELPLDLRLELYAQHATAWPELLGIVLTALVLSCILITVRELLPAKVSRD